MYPLCKTDGCLEIVHADFTLLPYPDSMHCIKCIRKLIDQREAVGFYLEKPGKEGKERGPKDSNENG